MTLKEQQRPDTRTKHYVVKYFNDAYDGESAYLYAFWGRLKGLHIDVSPMNRETTIGLKAQYKVTIKKDDAYRRLDLTECRELLQKEKVIRQTAMRLSLERRKTIGDSDPKNMSIANIRDFKRDAPELFNQLPRKERKISEPFLRYDNHTENKVKKTIFNSVDLNTGEKIMMSTIEKPVVNPKTDVNRYMDLTECCKQAYRLFDKYCGVCGKAILYKQLPVKD